MRDLVEVIAKALVDDPESVEVTEKTEGKTIIIEVLQKLSQKDLLMVGKW